MKDLIAMLEAATEGRQELDARVIAAVVGAEHVEQSTSNGRWCVYSSKGRMGWRLWTPQTQVERDLWRQDIGPTRSLDAALLLVPEDCMWFIGHLDPPSDMRLAATVIRIEGVGSERWRGYSKHAPLAMCIAALKAREAA